MTRLLDEAAGDRYDQAVFYELGRNFWFFDGQLGRIPSLTTGFAIANRFYAMETSGLVGAPWSGSVGFDTFRYSILVELLDRYLSDTTLTWQTTLVQNKAPANPHGWNGNDLAAAFYHKIRADHGDAGYRRFWQLMKGAPHAGSPRDSIARFVQIARAASGKDYRALMKDMSLPLTIDYADAPAAGLGRVRYRGFNGPRLVIGDFTRTDGNRWIENNDSGDGTNSKFRSLSESSSEILLYDDARDIYLSLDLSRKEISWRLGSEPRWIVSYTIVGN